MVLQRTEHQERQHRLQHHQLGSRHIKDQKYPWRATLVDQVRLDAQVLNLAIGVT
jgi:hypothetical protein